MKSANSLTDEPLIVAQRVCQLQLPKHGSLLGLASLHPAEDVVEDAHSAKDISRKQSSILAAEFVCSTE